MKIWIDLSNSPHPLLLSPIARSLEERGHRILVTARDNAQTVELAHERWPSVRVFGTASPKGRYAKAAAMAARVSALARWARRHGPEVALSHNSYGQILAARLVGIKTVTAMDFEDQPANHLAFRLAHRVLLPAALQDAPVRRQGATAKKTIFYPGLKEEIYLGDFEPDPNVLTKLGFEPKDSRPTVLLRTPPSRAAYHRFANPQFEELLERVGRDPGVRCVVLTRHPEQRGAIAALRLPSVILPPSAVDSRSLMRAVDLVVGAGGTMTREAAVLGVPTVSLFAGRQPAADRWLERRGLLRRIERIPDAFSIERRQSQPRDLEHLRRRGTELIRTFVDTVEEVALPVAR